ncbi:hypothetical protein [Leisingera sp. ANG-Vp]|uniref:hypothetical protein n=1 Tax=Leisingera sp. ANG-Vp TaxID=1577896 RepID=UPI0012699F76|nr:hypothetical protein [Leisingera sp. ANG-Vp]
MSALKAFLQGAATVAGTILLIGLVLLTLFVWWLYWTSGQSRAAKEARLAACHFSETAVLDIEGNLIEVPARFSARFRTVDGVRFRHETPEGPNANGSRRPSFCLDGPQSEPMAAAFLSLGFGGEFGAFAKARGMPGEFFLLKVYAGTDLLAAPDEERSAVNPAEPVIYRRRPVSKGSEAETVGLAMRGRSRDGFRTDISCTSSVPIWLEEPDGWRWACDFLIADFKTGLRYRYSFAVLEQRSLDTGWAVSMSLEAARKTRQLIADLRPLRSNTVTQQDL